MTEFFKHLIAPFDPEQIHWRVGVVSADKSKGLALAYMDARDVMDRLDAVCGPDGWQNRYSSSEGLVICEIGLLVGPNNWVWKADGAGVTDIEAEKGAASDAFKRAAVRWGIGRYLYDIKGLWVKIEPAGKSFKISPSEYQLLRKSLVVGSPPISPSPVRNWKAEAQAMAQGITESLSLAALDDFIHSNAQFTGDLKAVSPRWHQLLLDQMAERRKTLEGT